MPPHGFASIPGNEAPGILNAEGANSAQPVKTATKTTTYPFVDLIRFISTIGIVFIHTEIPLNGKDFDTVLHGVNHVEYYFLLRQIFKFATICYFLIAGFLLADKAIDANPFKYYLRRLNVLAKPYLLAFIIFIVLLIVYSYTPENHVFTVKYMLSLLKYAMFYTPFWYVPNYLLCLLVIVCFSKYSGSLYFGAALFLVTLGYTYTYVYTDNYTSSHTTALFGFVFYMWLGVYIKKNDLVSKIKSISPLTWGGIVLIFFALSNCETYYLFNYTHTHDSLNTLRITNQLYSVAFFAFLISCCSKAPKFGIFNPRKETYGIYLYHSFFIYFVIPVLEIWVSKLFKISLFSYNIYTIIAITLVNFAICYLASTTLVKLLLRFKLAYLPPL